MDIGQMTQASQYLLVLSILFAAAAVVIFFVLDIPRCWNMVIGTHSTRLYITKRNKKTCSKKEKKALKEGNCTGTGEPAKKEFLEKSSEETLLLKRNIEKQEVEETMLLVSNDKAHFIKEELIKEQAESEETVLLCIENSPSSNDESDLTTQLDMENGMILIQDILYMHEDVAVF